jgi:Spy/CpxP family protein refolding chaperone
MKSLAIALALSLAAGAALAQSPYAGMQTRSIKTLSEQQIADLKAGRGMGLALAAELNGYPGPSHVLELSDKLGLTAEQKAGIQELFDSMKAEAIPLGTRLLDEESELNRLFASNVVTPESLRDATARIGATQADLRNTHLKYHLKTVQILSPEQTEKYAALRGYDSDAPHQRPHHQPE